MFYRGHYPGTKTVAVLEAKHDPSLRSVKAAILLSKSPSHALEDSQPTLIAQLIGGTYFIASHLQEYTLV